MGNQTNAWSQLATNTQIQYAIPYIDPNSLQPALDGGMINGLPTGGGFIYIPNVNDGPFTGIGAFAVGTAGDIDITDPINSGGQVDSYVPTLTQAPNVLGGVPGHTVSASRGTRYIPIIVQDGDFLGEFAGYGLVEYLGNDVYKRLAGINFYASGVDSLFVGGKMRFGTTADITGVFTEYLELSNVGAFGPISQGSARLGQASKGYSRLTLDYTNSGTIGAVVINKPCGRANIAAGQSSVVITNNLITSNSEVFANLVGTDGTLLYIRVVIPAAGQVTITGNANATGNTAVAFLVINTDS